jgi:hypothetical protein
MMVAMNADPASISELLGRPEPETHDHLRLVPSPAEQAVLDVSPSVEEMARREFSQEVYARAVRRCFDAESLPFEKRDHAKVQGLVKAKGDWLGMLASREAQEEALFSAYSFHLDAPHTQEHQVAA